MRVVEPTFPTDFATPGEFGDLVFSLLAVDFTLVFVVGFTLDAVEDPGFALEPSGFLRAGLAVNVFFWVFLGALGFFLDTAGLFPRGFFIFGLGFDADFLVVGASSS